VVGAGGATEADVEAGLRQTVDDDPWCSGQPHVQVGDVFIAVVPPGLVFAAFFAPGRRDDAAGYPYR
jgi:hypothetical protein